MHASSPLPLIMLAKLTALWSSIAFSLASLFFLPAIGLLFLLSSLCCCFSDCDSSGTGVFSGSLTMPSSFWVGFLLGLRCNRIAALGKVCLRKYIHVVFECIYGCVCMCVVCDVFMLCVHMYICKCVHTCALSVCIHGTYTCMCVLTDMLTYISALLSSVAQYATL